MFKCANAHQEKEEKGRDLQSVSLHPVIYEGRLLFGRSFLPGDTLISKTEEEEEKTQGREI